VSTDAPQRLHVPFLDLAPSHAPLKAGLVAEIEALIDSGRFTNGPHVAAFEERFAAYCGTAECVGTASGLDALRFALLALDLEPDAEVVVPANTFVATVEAVAQAGARPVLVDVSETDYNMDPEAVESVLTDRTRVLLPVHLYGQLADMRRLRALAERHELRIVEDACQAHGASRDGLRAGATGDAAAFSFYPGKNLGAFGDAGALVSDDADVASRARMLREHGQVEKYRHRIEGYTSRLDTIQALVLLAKLPALERWNAERRGIAAAYAGALAEVGNLVLPPVADGSDPAWHLFVVRVPEPERFQTFLADRGIHTGRHYPEPVHQTEAFAHLGYDRGAFPVSERLAAEVVSLPIYPGMTAAHVEAVCDAIKGYFAGG
jgi:dTDP-4-amino-4,6-dideoxygalactose transaminase